MSVGVWQVVLILLVVLIVFGAGKLPKVMGDLGKGMRSFKKGLSDLEDEPTSGLSAEDELAQKIIPSAQQAAHTESVKGKKTPLKKKTPGRSRSGRPPDQTLTKKRTQKKDATLDTLT